MTERRPGSHDARARQGDRRTRWRRACPRLPPLRTSADSARTRDQAEAARRPKGPWTREDVLNAKELRSRSLRTHAAAHGRLVRTARAPPHPPRMLTTAPPARAAPACRRHARGERTGR
eukprot:scaffold142027_cov157-Phaeocystis_antarctica.AAC.2